LIFKNLAAFFNPKHKQVTEIMWFIVIIVSFVASLLTFFSGFGLGTLLLPVFALFFSLEEAVAMTGIVHLLNNLFKIGLVGKHSDWNVVLRFGIPAFLAAFLGAWCLSNTSQVVLFAWNNGNYEVTWLKIIMALLMLFFALMELIPTLKNTSFDKKYLSIGGLLSGFFGGYSGHQGALRSAFLIRMKLSKDTLVATGVAIACLIDISRLSVYYKNIINNNVAQHWTLLAAAIIAAFTGAFLGNQLLKKVTFHQVQQVVAVGLIVMALCLGAGVI
jgi:uncharacterized protein